MRQLVSQSPLTPSPRQRQDMVVTRSEPAIVGFAAFSLLGAIAMSYYCRVGLESASNTIKPAAEPPVYSAKAVPLDDVNRPLGAALVNAAPQVSADNLQAVVNDGRRIRVGDKDDRETSLAPAGAQQGATLYSFPELDALQRATALGSPSAIAGSVAAQSGYGNVEAPQEAFTSIVPAPEPNAWSCAGALTFVFCLAERLRRRAARS